MEDNKKILDLSDCSDERIEEITRGINMWRAAGDEPMRMVLKSRNDSDIARARWEGVLFGTIASLAAVGVGVAIRKARPKIKKVGAKIKEKFTKK